MRTHVRTYACPAADTIAARMIQICFTMSNVQKIELTHQVTSPSDMYLAQPGKSHSPASNNKVEYIQQGENVFERRLV